MTLKSTTPPLLPGKHKNTVFLLNKANGFTWLLEKVDADLFELTIAVYEGEDGNEQRTEYVLHCCNESLVDLKAHINKIVK